MDTEDVDIIYSPKYHPDTDHLLKQAMSTAVSLLVITLLTIGALWFTSRTTGTPVILGTNTVSAP